MDIQTIAKEFYDNALYFKGYSAGTVKRYKYTINLYVKLSGISIIQSVNEENVRTLFFEGRTTRKWSANTALVFHKSLHVFFEWCIERRYMFIPNPINRIDRPKIEYRLPKKLTKQDTLRLLEIVYNYPYASPFLRYRNHAIFATFIFAGLRKSELLNLKYGDVDIDNLTIFVSQGKGCKDRFIPMSETLARILKAYMEQRKKMKKTCPEFFTSFTTNRGFTEDGLKHFVESVRKIFTVPFSLHKLRHTFATLMLEGGCDLYSLSKMMGHTDIKTTTVYLYASANHLRDQMVKHPMND